MLVVVQGAAQRPLAVHRRPPFYIILVGVANRPMVQTITSRILREWLFSASGGGSQSSCEAQSEPGANNFDFQQGGCSAHSP